LLLWAIINHPSRIVKQKAAKQAVEAVFCGHTNRFLMTKDAGPTPMMRKKKPAKMPGRLT
jgi:hypothetical protein